MEINRLYIACQVERLWLLSFRWNIDQDLYKIEASFPIQNLPEAMQADQVREGDTWMMTMMMMMVMMMMAMCGDYD